MENELIKVEKLQSQSQWTMWKFQVKIILKSSDVYEVVSGEKSKPEDANAADYEAKLAAWKKEDMKAQRVIVTTISQKVMVHIVNCTTSCEMWNRLHSVFEKKSETGILYLQQRYYSYTRDPRDDMASYISKLEEIVQQLADLDLVIPEQMVISKIILSLPSEYRHFSSAWESTSKDERTLDNLRTRLMTEESRFQSEGLRLSWRREIFQKGAIQRKMIGHRNNRTKAAVRRSPKENVSSVVKWVIFGVIARKINLTQTRRRIHLPVHLCARLQHRVTKATSGFWTRERVTTCVIDAIGSEILRKHR